MGLGPMFEIAPWVSLRSNLGYFGLLPPVGHAVSEAAPWHKNRVMKALQPYLQQISFYLDSPR